VPKKFLYCNIFEVVEKTAEPSGTSGRIYVPRKWIGKKVRAVLLE
jgi:putative transposon-encoded protein